MQEKRADETVASTLASYLKIHCLQISGSNILIENSCFRRYLQKYILKIDLLCIAVVDGKIYTKLNREVPITFQKTIQIYFLNNSSANEANKKSKYKAGIIYKLIKMNKSAI